MQGVRTGPPRCRSAAPQAVLERGGLVRQLLSAAVRCDPPRERRRVRQPRLPAAGAHARSRRLRQSVPRPSGKEIYTLYNATGHTFYGWRCRPNCRPTSTSSICCAARRRKSSRADGQQRVRLFLPRDEVACLAVLPRKLAVATPGNRLEVRAYGADADSRVALCDRDGKEIASVPLTGGKAEVPLGPAAGQRACVKLYRAGRLLDAAACPVAE